MTQCYRITAIASLAILLGVLSAGCTARSTTTPDSNTSAVTATASPVQPTATPANNLATENAVPEKTERTESTTTETRRDGEATHVASRTRRGAYSNGSRQVYYDYGQPQHRSFWQKHRDKLTVGGGTLGGALIGGLVGGGKGAAIGALAGGGGSALYTYKLRKKHHNSNY